MPEQKLIKVLSIDGGGIRGIIPGMVLAEIEQHTGKPVALLFDLIAGTSTGGILALGLTKPDPQNPSQPQYSAHQTLEMYTRGGPRIFPHSFLHELTTAGSLLGEKYPADGIEEVLDQYFGEARLKEALTDVIISSYDTERRDTYFFKSAAAKTEADRDFPIKQVARATSAAPTYFEPLKLDLPGGTDYYSLIDGGVFANNPAMCAYIEALCKKESQDILLVSLGTGEATHPLPHKEVKDWGLVNWARPLLDVVFDAVSDCVDYQLKSLLSTERNSTRRYYRFQTRLDENDKSMDITTQDHLRNLQLAGERLIKECDQDLDMLCQQLLG
ncbi:MAG TPA: patatin-like phospholipase family protein [Chloroflexia bacterium]|nr:patatin-like phospholipase family protein [Chloroflexia bacterium]